MKTKKLLPLLVSLVFLIMTACSGSGTSEGDSDSNQPVELVYWTWIKEEGHLGKLIDQYEAENTHVTIKVQEAGMGDVRDNLQTSLAAGSGAPDIINLEIGFVDKFLGAPQYFHNLSDYGADDIKSNYLDWKWNQGVAGTGEVIALPMDVGPMAMSYRTDLFELAGLPTDAEGIQTELNTWEKLIDAGVKLKAATGKPMFDSVEYLFYAMIAQTEERYFDKESGELMIETNEAVKRAWDLSVSAVKQGITGNIAPWTPEWGTAMNNGDFAVLLTPSWLSGYLKTNAADAKGKWSLTMMPEGGGNMGGSFYALPKEGKHPDEAYKFIQWMSAPEQQLEFFKEDEGFFPSTPSVYSDAVFQDNVDEYYGTSIGAIFSEAAEQMPPAYQGPDYLVAQNAIVAALKSIESGGADPEQAWTEMLDKLTRELGR